MAIHAQLKIADIPGESKRRDHKDEIELLSWRWGVENTTSAGGASGGGAGKAIPHELEFTHHRYDKASPLLAKACAGGKRIAMAVLAARKSGGGQKGFLTIALKDVRVGSGSVAAGDDGIDESVALDYGGIDVAYKPQDAKGGFGTPVASDWNVMTNRVSRGAQP